MSRLCEIQTAVKQLNDAEKYEFSKWFWREMDLSPMTDDVTDAIALERFRALDAEEQLYAQRPAR